MTGCALTLAVTIPADSVAEDVWYLFVLAAIAALAPLIVGLLRLRIAEVVMLIALGVVVGPDVLGWVAETTTVATFSQLGLAFLYFLAGYELDLALLRTRAGRLAGVGWLVSMIVAILVVSGLVAWGVVNDRLGIAIALTATALGTLLPALRDSGRLNTGFGRFFLGAGAFGEFGPIVATALFLSATSMPKAIFALVLFAGGAWLIAQAPGRLGTRRVQEVMERGNETSSQTALRWTILLVLLLLVLTEVLKLDSVMGAFIAGIIFRKYAPEGGYNVLMPRVEALGFGFFIPLFFVVSGVSLDITSIAANPILVPIFLVLLFAARGLPQLFIYRRAMPAPRDRWQFSFYVATSLPIIVAVTTLEVQNGVMETKNAAALIGAGALSVLVFPLLGDLIGRSRGTLEADRDADATREA